MTGQTTIQDVLFFPQMRPEKAAQKDGPEKYAAAGRRQTPPGRWMYHPHEYPTFLFV